MPFHTTPPSSPPPQRPQAPPQRPQQTPQRQQGPSTIFQRYGGRAVWPQELNLEIDRILPGSRQEERDFIKQVFSKYHDPTSQGITEKERDEALEEIEKVSWIGSWTKQALRRGLRGS